MNRADLRWVAVSFDRRQNDDDFSYHYFDLTLVILDAIMGGRGIYKPVNQLRVLRWNATCGDLLAVLRHLAAHNDELKFRRILIIPYPNAPVGRKLDRSVHMR